jgi:hypothetical protein
MNARLESFPCTPQSLCDLALSPHLEPLFFIVSGKSAKNFNLMTKTFIIQAVPPKTGPLSYFRHASRPVLSGTFSI